MISCANHDYVEIACMYGFEIKLVLIDGKIVSGKALQTAVNKAKEECIVLHTDQGIEKFELSQAISMEAVTNNPHFKTIDFK